MHPEALTAGPHVYSVPPVRETGKGHGLTSSELADGEVSGEGKGTNVLPLTSCTG